MKRFLWRAAPGRQPSSTSCEEMPFADLFQCCADQLATGLEEPARNSREIGRQALLAIFDHSCVPQGVLMCNNVRYAVAVEDGFTVEAKQGGSQVSGSFHALLLWSRGCLLTTYEIAK